MRRSEPSKSGKITHTKTQSLKITKPPSSSCYNRPVCLRKRQIHRDDFLANSVLGSFSFFPLGFGGISIHLADLVHLEHLLEEFKEKLQELLIFIEAEERAIEVSLPGN